MAQTYLPFKDGQPVEVRSFEHGFRGAWFRCKIIRTYIVDRKLCYSLKYLDYENEEIHEQQVFQRFEDEEKEWLMVRPAYPLVHKVDGNLVPLLGAAGSWKVGDLIDWHKDGCYWSGAVLAIKNNALQVEHYPPPRGEGGTCLALSKDLRRSLEWSLEDGWTLPSTDRR
ncbi:Agenet-like domain-containing protein [Hirschfeldia incana]|nr:Agenet-like domain-containing protein [Hirschfeldia incana]